MKSEGIRQAKAHLSALVRAAAAGEPCLVTDNGKLVAMIAPPPVKPLRAEARTEPAGVTKPLSDKVAFRQALLGAPYPLELDF
jgi:prevent-host-death family protein